MDRMISTTQLSYRTYLGMSRGICCTMGRPIGHQTGHGISCGQANYHITRSSYRAYRGIFNGILCCTGTVEGRIWDVPLYILYHGTSYGTPDMIWDVPWDIPWVVPWDTL